MGETSPSWFFPCYWDEKTGEDEIRKLLTDYGLVKESNILLNSTAHSRSEAFREWREGLKFLGVSCEALREKFPPLAKVLDMLLKICKHEDILPDQLKAFLSELTAQGAEIRNLLNDDKRLFAEVYAPYLDNLNDADIGEIKSKLTTGMFELPKTECNAKVKAAAEESRKNQLKTQLFKLWKDKTATKNPLDWSYKYRTPILCCVQEKEFDAAKKTFETLNRNNPGDAEIKSALAFLEATSLFEVLSDESKRNAAFEQGIVGEYRLLLTNREDVRDALDRLSLDTYDWRENPSVKSKVRQLAEGEYNSGGSDKALAKIDKMDDAQLKHYLKRLVRESMTVGIEIMANGGE